MESGLRVSGLVSGYERRPALHGVNLEVPRGSVCAVVGPNGAGKTTLIRCVMGLLPAWRGGISWGGHFIERASIRARVKRGIAVVPQGAPTFPNMTVIQNLLVASRVNSDGAEAAASVAAALELFPELADRPLLQASSLSGGQRQMLAISRALCQRPTLLLVDEPSFGLAVGVRHRVVEALRRFRDDHGGTVLIVEQDANMIRQLADAAYFMSGGALEETGAHAAGPARSARTSGDVSQPAPCTPSEAVTRLGETTGE